MRVHAAMSTSNCEQSLLINHQVVSMESHDILYLSVDFTFSPFSCPPPLHLPLACRLISNQFLSLAHKYSPERSWPFLSGGRQLGIRRRLKSARRAADLSSPPPFGWSPHQKICFIYKHLQWGGKKFNKYIRFIKWEFKSLVSTPEKKLSLDRIAVFCHNRIISVEICNCKGFLS